MTLCQTKAKRKEKRKQNKTKKEKNCCLKKIIIIGEIHLVISKRSLLFLKHIFCFPYFLSFVSHVPSLRYVLIKVLDFRDL